MHVLLDQRAQLIPVDRVDLVEQRRLLRFAQLVEVLQHVRLIVRFERAACGRQAFGDQSLTS